MNIVSDLDKKDLDRCPGCGLLYAECDCVCPACGTRDCSGCAGRVTFFAQMVDELAWMEQYDQDSGLQNKRQTMSYWEYLLWVWDTQEQTKRWRIDMLMERYENRTIKCPKCGHDVHTCDCDPFLDE